MVRQFRMTYMPAKGKKTLKRRKQSQTASHPGEVQTHCPHCLTSNSEKSALSLVDELYRSQTELCATLRLVGRQLLHFEQQGDGLLDKAREVLKRAEHIQKTVRSESVLSEALSLDALYGNGFAVEAPTPDSEYSTEQATGEDMLPKTGRRRSRLQRPHALRVIKFPGR